MRLKSLALTTAFVGSIIAANAATTIGTTYPVPANITDKSIPQFGSSTNFFSQMTSRFQMPENPTIVSFSMDPGRTASFLAQQNPNSQIISIFFNNDFRKFAKKNYQTPRVTFRQGDFTQPQKSLRGQADMVFSSWMTNLIPQNSQRATLENMRQTLKDGGFIAIITPMQGSMFTQAINTVASQAKWKNMFQGQNNSGTFFTPSEYSSMMKSAGFTNIQTESATYTTQFPTRNDLRNFVYTAVGNFLPSLNKTQRKEFINEVTDEYMRSTSTTGNAPIPFSADLMLATGQNQN